MFDRYLQGSAGPRWRFSLAPISIAAHVLIVAGAVAATIASPRSPSGSAGVPVTYLLPRAPSPSSAPPSAAPAPVPASAPHKPARMAALRVPSAKARLAAKRSDSPLPDVSPASGSAAPSAAGAPGAAPGAGVGQAPGAAPAPKIVPQFVFDRERLTAPDPHLPDWFKDQHPHQVITGLYRICVGVSGQIIDVQVMNGIPGVDAAIVAHLRSAWRYKPQPVPVCSPRLFRFQVN